MALPVDIANRSIDAVGCSDQVIGDIEEGTPAANLVLRHYIPCLEQLLRGALWNFSRKQAPLFLLGAQCGYASWLPPGPPVGNRVIPPWIYEYAWPIDCIAARFVPFNYAFGEGDIVPGNTNVPAEPPTTAGPPYSSPPFMRPVPMLVASDNNYPMPSDPQNPPTEWWNTRGQAIDARLVVLTNQPCAQLVYTVFQPYPNLWDPLFEEAFVAYLGTKLWNLNPDKKIGMALRNEQIAIARAALSTARVRDGDEGWPSVERQAEWITARRIGASYGGWGWPWGFGEVGAGVLGYGWSGVSGIDGGGAY
jgi:hypothetical protein